VPEWLFYDGNCGLCHRWVRFVIRADRDGSKFRFAPLGGETFNVQVPESWRASLPSSIVVKTGDGRLLVRSAAILHILDRLGGLWRVLGIVGRSVPRSLRDSLYDWIARIRHKLFARPADVCPVLPPALRSRFAR